MSVADAAVDTRNCLQRALDGPTGKRWTTMPCLSDHITILNSHLSGLFGAYTGCCGAAIEHDYVEAIMVAVNSTIECPYCDGLHTELAAASGHGDEIAKKLLSATDVGSATSAVNLPGVAYARKMGELNVRSEGEGEAYAELVKAEGADRAKSIKSLAIFLYWGGMTGNTVNCCKKRLIGVAPLKGLTLFSLLFFLWYGPLFFVVFFYNTCVIPVFRAVFGESTKNQVHSAPRSFPSTGYLRLPICGSLSDRHMPGETLHLPCRSGSSSLRASCSGSLRCFGCCLSASSRCSSRSACPRCVRRSRGSSRRNSRWSETAASRCWHRLP